MRMVDQKHDDSMKKEKKKGRTKLVSRRRDRKEAEQTNKHVTLAEKKNTAHMCMHTLMHARTHTHHKMCIHNVLNPDSSRGI